MSNAQLQRISYVSAVDKTEREFFLYLPTGYEAEAADPWPVILFLHGDGERGDTPDDLDYVLQLGPLYEAWIQKRDLPFIIIAPQLWLFERDKTGPDYLTKRTKAQIPRRLEHGSPPHTPDMRARQLVGPMIGATAAELLPPFDSVIAPTMWDRADPDVVHILEFVLAQYQADPARVYLTGVSLGGMGVWYYASRYPDRFAAICPVVGYGTIEQAEIIAQAGIPIWAFSGGRDPAVPTQTFYPAMNRLDELGADFRFTTEQDMAHDVWNRVYAGEDIYHWFLRLRREKQQGINHD